MNRAQRRRGRPRRSAARPRRIAHHQQANVPKNITPIFLPSRAPELNPVENVWQYLRQNWL
jgi:transposase